MWLTRGPVLPAERQLFVDISVFLIYSSFLHIGRRWASYVKSSLLEPRASDFPRRHPRLSWVSSEPDLSRITRQTGSRSKGRGWSLRPEELGSDHAGECVAGHFTAQFGKNQVAEPGPSAGLIAHGFIELERISNPPPSDRISHEPLFVLA